MNKLTVLLCALCVHQSYGYVAKVLDYYPDQGLNPMETMIKNVESFRSRITTNDDIVVFPEYALTSTKVDDNFKEYAIEVPEPKHSGSICDQNSEGSGTQKILIQLACIAEEKSTYLVVNLLEKHEKKSIFYNTNVVFNRKGQIVAKYRKINLFGSEKEYLTAGTEIVTFTTDFGVTFGTFICFDILFENPAQTILRTNVTDIIYTTAWFSELPYFAALSVQDGYAKMAGVNLLVSGYNHPIEGNGGSGIYHQNGKNNIILQTLSTKSVIQDDVFKVGSRNPDRVCGNLLPSENNPSNGTESRGILPGLDTFKLKNDFKSHPEYYTSHKLDSSKRINEKRLCSNNGVVCCNFYARTFLAVDDSPIYNFVASYNTDRQEYGCALVACQSDDIKSCGILLKKNKHPFFLNVNINATLEEGIGLHSFPVTTDQKLKPFPYKFCHKANEIVIDVAGQQEISTVGLFISSGSYSLSNLCLILVTVFIARYMV